ncbi:flavin-containing monooxygenase [Rhodococcoides kyotonense]|uniref:Predicted flavoprotein CzcO associated with the cation diffusion facilitator CzcD n=1 Tax=Rhodococcoides kyotonense TaxID=398843 RepID=A0A239K8R9_9NOCA|nr:NAD(P)/FAD-dependent oxidoreductase [Rhodococcus kyotonensis]SNT14421.1 Predicted flavoprotein CzcO associated with the cation diffusion facilitator CzcD [Rhodococcus kyotonensis]
MTNTDAHSPTVAIIGAGFGGLAAAIELERNGIDSYEVFERADSVGGVWRANTYPGAACDVPSSIYSYSFDLDADWSARFGTQSEIRDYLQRAAEKYGVSTKISFGREVSAARFEDHRWRLEFVDGEDREFDALICATGLLSKPRIPDVEVSDGFGGSMFHSAEWDHSVDLTGKRVVVVGSGASAVQLVPKIVDDVAELAVVQRSPNWVVDRHDYRANPLIGRLLRRFPSVMRLQHNLEFLWYELRSPLIYNRMDPFRRILEGWMRLKIRRQISDPVLRSAVTPEYRAMCNRLLMSNDWYPALDRDHVSVHRQGIRRVAENSVELSDGETVPADVVVWCTGFAADEYLAPIAIIGRDGRNLHVEWKENPEAYLGISVSGFPNLFMIYGPGTASNVNTVIFMLEKEARFVRTVIERIAQTGGWVDVRQDAQDEYNSKRAVALSKTVYGTGCPGWLSGKDGKPFAVWPGTHLEYAHATRRVDFDAYEHGGVSTNAAASLATHEKSDVQRH